MKKHIIITLCLILAGNILFSQKRITRSGEIKFEASVPAFEEIAATNNSVSCIFDESNGNFVALALIKAFKFKSSLMEEHFNENYMESSSFPKSTFKGKILNYVASKLNSTKSIYDLDGELTIHGVSKKIKTKITLFQNGGKIIAVSNFAIKPQDYGIKIPNLVKGKIAENVNVAVHFVLEQQ